MPINFNMSPMAALSSIAARVGKRIDSRMDTLGIENPSDGSLTNIVVKNTQSSMLDLLYGSNKQEFDRTKVIQGSWKIFLGDSSIQQAIEGIGDDATAGDNEDRPYTIVPGNNEKLKPKTIRAIDSILELNSRLCLEDLSSDIIAWTLLEGSYFREIVINEDQDRIVDFQDIEGPREGFLLTKMIDDFKMVQSYNHYNIQSSRNVRKFSKWQVVPFERRKKSSYGIPLLGSLLNEVHRLRDLESDMAIARKERAYLRLAHIYKDASPAQIEKFAQLHAEQQAKSSTGPVTDHFSNSDMKLLDPRNSQLSSIPDIEYHRNKIYTGTRRPKNFSGGEGANSNRAILDKQEQVYARFLSKMRKIVTKGYREIFDLHLLINGHLPSDVKYKIIWTDIQPETFLNTVSALSLLADFGLSHYSILSEAGFEPKREGILKLEKKQEYEKLGLDMEASDTSGNINTGEKPVDKKEKETFQKNGNGTIAKRTEAHSEIRNIVRNRVFNT